MMTFILDEHNTAVCQNMSRRGGFKHVATLMRDGQEVGSVKCLYVNRTWESYIYKSVLYKLVDKFFVGEEKEKMFAVIRR